MNDAPWWLAGGAAAAYITQRVTDWFTSRRSSSAAEGGAAALIEGLTTRLQSTEARIAVLEQLRAEEINARVMAQEMAAMLRVRVRQLEHALRINGIELPPNLDESEPANG